MQLNSINPKNNKIINSWDIHNDNEIELIISKSYSAFQKWKDTDFIFRLECIKKISKLLRDRKKEFGTLMANEMGKPVKQGIGEIEKCAWLCDYYYENSEVFLKPVNVKTNYYKSYITFQPIGIILGVMPWNFPFWQVFRFAIPSLVVGNGVILKHASNVQGCAYAIEDCFKDAGYHENIFKNLCIPGTKVDNVINNNKISAVTLTGSTPAGISVAKKAGENLKKTVLELGGSDPYLIFEDANIDIAVSACIDGRILNAGQSCIAAKRLIITKNNEEDFIEKLKSQLSLKIMGDPIDDVDIGPMVSNDSRKEVHEQVMNTIEAGATLHIGGYIPDIEGAYYPITLISGVTPGMPGFDEEIFGPVFSVITANDNNHAITLANKTEFGLGAAIFTKDIKYGEMIAKNQIQSGACFINDFVKSDPRLPFGGVKMSGYGRELSSYGLMEFVNIKTVVVNDL